MPRKEHARKGHKKSFLKRQKQFLETKLRECLEQRKQALSSLAAIEITRADLADFASAILEQDLKLHQTNCCAQELRGICQAIQNIESGTYGICENCEGLIPEKRLEPKAKPWATKCTKCQVEEERRA